MLSIPGAGQTTVHETSPCLQSRRGRQMKREEINMILAGGGLKKLEWGNELAGD